MGEARTTATIATLSALIVASDLALYGALDVKLDAAVVFLATLAYGVRVGAPVAVISELVWSQVSPWGPSGAYLLPFLLTAELLYVLAGWAAGRLLRGSPPSPRDALLFGGTLGLATFAWDVWTNLGIALLGTTLSLPAVLVVEFNPAALAFNVAHELSNLLLGLALVPAALLLLRREGGSVAPGGPAGRGGDGAR